MHIPDRRIISIGLGTLSLLSLVYIVLSPIRYINDTYYAALIPLGSSICFLYSNRRKPVLRERIDKIDLIFSGLLTFLLMAMLSVINMLQTSIFTDSIDSVDFIHRTYLFWGRFGLIPSIAVSSFYSLISIFAMVSRPAHSTVAVDQRKRTWTATLFMSVISIAFCLSAYPSILHDDGTYMWQQATWSAGWSDWHPVSYIVLLYISRFIADTPFTMICFQTIAWIITMRVAFILLEARGVSSIVYFLATLVASFMSYVYLHILYKDVLYSIALFGMTVSIIGFFEDQDRLRWMIGIGVYGAIVSISRHAAIGPVVVTIGILAIWVLFAQHNKQKTSQLIIICLIPVLLVYLGLRAFAFNYTNVIKNPGYVIYTVPIHMLGAYAASDVEIDEKSRALMEELMPLEKWKEGYNKDPFLADTLARQWGIMGFDIEKIDKEALGGEIISANWRFLTNYPTDYLRAYFTITSLIWEISRQDEYGEWYGTVFENCSSTLSNIFPYLDVKRNALTNILEPASILLYSMPLLRNIIFRGGWSVFALLVISYIAIRQRRKEILLAMIPVLSSVLLLMLSIPAQDPRFVMPIINCAVFLGFYLFGVPGNQFLHSIMCQKGNE